MTTMSDANVAVDAPTGDRRQTSGIGPSAVPMAAMATWGAGLILLALGAGAITLESSTFASRFVGVFAFAVGAAGLGAGAFALRRASLPSPRAWIAGCLVAIATASALLALDGANTGLWAVVGLIVLAMIVGLIAAGALRSAAREAHGASRASAGGPRSPSARRARTAGLFAGAVIVAAIATPAIGATQAGVFAPDHSDMPGMEMPGMPGMHH